MTVAAIAIVLFDMGVIFTKVGTGITVEAIALFEIIPMTREEDEHIIATPSYGLFLLSDRN
jgi:hypothetical protein